MHIRKLRTNHIETPMGYTFDPLTLSWITESTGKEQAFARITISTESDFSTIVYDSGKGQLDSVAFHPDIDLMPMTRYYWQVEVTADDGDSSQARSFFETGKMETSWTAAWIRAPFDASPQIIRDIDLTEVVSARIYMVGLGVYELYCNGAKVGDEYLAPGFHSYDHWLQSHTYDLTPYLTTGLNTIGFIMGDGWYRGPLGWSGIEAKPYGDELIVKAEIHMTLADGSEKMIVTDDTWLCHKSPVVKSSIYYGEDYDARLEGDGWCHPSGNRRDYVPVVYADHSPQVPIQDRLSLPVKRHESFKPEVIHTKNGETVLDFGQNHAGWVEGDIHLAEGEALKLTYGELLQDGCFYRENMRTAEAQYTFISNGERIHFRPHFTFYGYRYVKVEGPVNEADLASFKAHALYSALDPTGYIETSNEKVNQLISNAFWGQKSNFVDVPTDCPQRDERVGWTGDTQAFSGTASFNMHTAGFYSKYMKDLVYEQSALDGGIPFIIPLIKTDNPKAIISKHSSCAWGDVATILPWTLYRFYGDAALLEAHYDAMKGWVDHIKKQDDASGAHRLWTTGFHFADWLALDNYKDSEGPFGGTDDHYIASAYYAHSAEMVSKAAKVLGYTEDRNTYEQLSKEIKEAMLREYFSPNGRCVTDTQTAKVIALYMDLVPNAFRQRIIEDLQQQLIENHVYLTTGFVGTTYLCSALSENGLNDMAYTLLLNEDMPSWLYEVNMGATTIWERWNSVMPDGKVNPKGMNSMNHYTYGSVVEWMYKYMCGLRPSEDEPGFRAVTIKPLPDRRMTHAGCTFDSPVGTYRSSWTLDDEGVTYEVTVPFGGKATVILEGLEPRELTAGGYIMRGPLPSITKREPYVDEKEGL